MCTADGKKGSVMTANPEMKAEMKIVVRSKYWGHEMKGREQRAQENPYNPYRVLSAQAFIKKSGPYWGCCPHAGSRVLDLTEEHFMAYCDGVWDLFYIGDVPANPNGHIVHDFFLMPQEQPYIHVEKRLTIDGWRAAGSVEASTVRENLEPLLRPFLDVRNEDGTPDPVKHHVHIQIMMDKAVDKDSVNRRKKKAGGYAAECNSSNDIGARAPDGSTHTTAVSRSDSWTTDASSPGRMKQAPTFTPTLSGKNQTNGTRHHGWPSGHGSHLPPHHPGHTLDYAHNHPYYYYQHSYATAHMGFSPMPHHPHAANHQVVHAPQPGTIAGDAMYPVWYGPDGMLYYSLMHPPATENPVENTQDDHYAATANGDKP